MHRFCHLDILWHKYFFNTALLKTFFWNRIYASGSCTAAKSRHPLEALFPITLALFWIASSIKLDRLKKNSPIISRFSGRLIFFKFLHSLNALFPIFVTLSGIIISYSALYVKLCSGTSFNPSGKATAFRFTQFANANSPIQRTLSGILTSIIWFLEAKIANIFERKWQLDCLKVLAIRERSVQASSPMNFLQKLLFLPSCILWMFPFECTNLSRNINLLVFYLRCRMLE